MLRAARFLISSILATTAGAQQDSLEPLRTESSEARPQKDGAAHWQTSTRREIFLRCPDEFFAERRLSGADLDRPEVIGNCAMDVALLTNLSDASLQCALTLEYDAPDLSDRTRWEGDLVVGAGDTARAFRTWATEGQKAPRFRSKCSVVPMDIVHRAVRRECRPRMSAPNPDSFYPAESRPTREQGDVIIEFTTTVGGELAEVRIARGTGSVHLDNAAFRVARATRAYSPCIGERMRFIVRFKMTDPLLVRGGGVAAAPNYSASNTSFARALDSTATPFSLRGS